MDDEPTERARVERWHRSLDGALPTRAVPGFGRRFSVVTEELVRAVVSKRAKGLFSSDKADSDQA